MSWTTRWRRACAGGIAFGMHKAAVRCGNGIGNLGTTNTCLTTVGLSGTTMGYDTALGIGSCNPTETLDGTAFYSFTWDYPAVTGLFGISWGPLGNTQLTDTDGILVVGADKDEVGLAKWDPVTESYQFTNLEAAQKLEADYDNGDLNEFCFTMSPLPHTIITYSFETIERGVA